MRKTALAIIGLVVIAIIVGFLFIALTFVYVLETIREEYQAPKSSTIIDEFFGLSPFNMKKAITVNLTAGASLNIKVNVTKDSSGGPRVIDFSVSRGVTTFLSYSRITTVDENWTVPINSTYNFVFDKSNYRWITIKDVTFQLTKHWIGTAYRDVTQNQQLLTFEFAYVGLVLVLVAIVSLVYFKKLRGGAKPL